ncbi:MAG TPA: glycosyltransferase [Puia sp.]
MLRSFETAIVEETGAEIETVPVHKFSTYLSSFGHGTNKSRFRPYFPKDNFDLNADVAWSVLMGPENYKLDSFSGWQKKCKIKVLYIYDTLPAQYPLIRKLFSDNTWDILITSFNDAADDLTKLTGRKWHCVAQAADKTNFEPTPLSERLIHFSSYGRRYPVLHDVLKNFCKSRGLYYDYTTHDARHPTAPAEELYRQYGWHLNHSLFTFSWPVELTNPARALHLRPITCRWFEAAAAGTVIIGRAPDNPAFNDWLSKDLVVPLDPDGDKKELNYTLGEIWDKRERFFEKAEIMRRQNIERWSWNHRVKEIQGLLK